MILRYAPIGCWGRETTDSYDRVPVEPTLWTK